ncbi:MAG: SPOR domain-containing protein [Gemmatimonadota bacterium]
MRHLEQNLPGHRPLGRFLPSLVALVILLCLPGSMRAQTSAPPFQDVIRLAQDGYGDSARVLIGRTLAKLPTSDPLYPEALYTAATVAKSGEEMRTLFSRVAIEFSSSAWADRSMLRLAQLDYGSGDSESAVGRIRRLFNDYPTSPVLPSAALWGSRAAFDHKDVQLGCDWITKGLALVGDDVELRNQLEFAKQRCAIGPGVEMAPANADSLRAKPAVEPAPSRADSLRAKPPAARPAAQVSGGKWRVQVAAISDKSAIRRAIQKIESTGLKAYQVAGPRGLTKLQAGPFTTREAAAAKIATLKAALGGSPFVVQVP